MTTEPVILDENNGEELRLARNFVNTDDRNIDTIIRQRQYLDI
ncbi:MAG: hypothetical protein ACEY3J_00370 [Arsenophonus sp.]